jgi:UDP-N-acetylglucosamine 2-epimerase
MIKIATIVGARPQFIKCASVSRQIKTVKDIEEVIIHTGQHYDRNMSEIFFRELDIPEPDLNLGIGSDSHAVQTARILTTLEKILLELKPDWVLVYGDTNSTIAAALAAAKLNMKIAHVEAGLRSFNRRMPEEINRIVTDHVSDLLFAPTRNAVDLLAEEGLSDRCLLTGDVMKDSVLFYRKLAAERYKYRDIIPFDKYYIATVHRQENTDDPERLNSIFKAFGRLDLPVVLPLHPRTVKLISGMEIHQNIRIIDPLGYLPMISLVSNADKVLTDSGGLQKEAYLLNKPCLTLRAETEWIETLDNGWNVLVDVDVDKIIEHSKRNPDGPQGDHYGDGMAGKKIVEALLGERSTGTKT